MGGGGVVYHVYFLYTLLKVVSHDDLSVLSMSAVGFQNRKFDREVGGWGELHSIFFGIF